MTALLAQVAAGLIVALRLYQLPAVQSRMPALLRWKSWGLGVKLLVIFLIPIATAILEGLSEGVAFGSALSAGVAAGAAAALGAIGGDKMTKEMGEVWDEGQIGWDPMHTPSAMRKASGIIFPLSKTLRR